MARQALGKGLDALIPGAKKLRAGQKGVQEISINEIKPNPLQPRKTFTPAGLEDLIKSVKNRGVIIPMIVKEIPGGKYELIAGERRFIAAQRAGLKTVPVIVKNVTSTEQLAIALTENIQREDLNPVEEALGYKQYMEIKGYTQEQIADEMGKNRATVANLLRTLKLPRQIQAYLASGQITTGHAKVLLGIDNETRQKALCEKIVKKGFSVRDLELMLKKDGKKKSRKKSADIPEMKEIEKKLKHVFGTKASVKGSYKKGKIEIEYYSQDDFERILEVLKISM